MRPFVVSGCMLALTLASTPTLAARPTADLVSVSAHTTFPTANRGGADEGSCFITNTSSVDVRVRLDVQVVYSNGKVQRLTGISDPGVLGPSDAYELDVFFVVPANASLGAATFVCDVRAQGSGGAQEQESARATFDVVP